LDKTRSEWHPGAVVPSGGDEGHYETDALRSSEMRFQEMALHIREAFRLFDCERQVFVFASPAYAQIWGHPVERLYENPQAWIESIHTDEQDRVAAAFEEIRRQGDGWTGEYRLVRPDGALRWVSDRFLMVKNAAGLAQRIVSIAEDITERRTAEEENRRRQKYVESVLYNAPDAIVTLDHEHRVVDWNPGAVTMFGYMPEETVGRNLDLLVARADVMEEAVSRTRQVLSGQRVPPFETVRYRKDGTPVHVMVAGSPIIIGKTLAGVVTVYTDITAIKQVEAALRESTEKMRTVIHTIPDPMAVIRLADNVCMDVNESFVTTTGLTREAVVGRQVAQVPIWNDPADLEKILHILAEHGEIKNLAITFRRSDGSPIDTLMSARVLTLNDRPHCVGIARDISALTAAQAEKENLQIRLRQAQKMEAIGTLAGGIAHDFNNLLMGIQGRNSLMLNETTPDHPFYEHLRGVEAYVRRAADLTGQLLGFARGGKYETRALDLNEIAAQSLSLFSRTRKELDIQAHYQKHIWTVEADPSQLEQVFLNLFVNSWQAMPAGGTLCAETENVVLDETQAASLGLPPGNFVRIGVTDTGIGIEKAVLERIFDPFFTTKTRGRGTGLGLASAYGIVKNHGGIINVESEKGRGSKFTIYLPASTRKPQPPSPVSQTVVRTGSETVLLVDDEAMILEVGCEMLKRLGYTVLSAASGEEALAVYQENRSRINLVLLDMIMPGMSGGELFDRLKTIDPGVIVLLSSGYSLDGQASRIMAQGCRGFIQKPFDLQQLSQKLRQVLDMMP
jgi:two-component system, cell cycle sensor histidine kinase and response regulator CckA